MDSSGALKEPSAVLSAWVAVVGCGAEPAPRKLSFLLQGHIFLHFLKDCHFLQLWGAVLSHGEAADVLKRHQISESPNAGVFHQLPWFLPNPSCICWKCQTRGQPHLSRCPHKGTPGGDVISPPRALGHTWVRLCPAALQGLANPGSPVATVSTAQSLARAAAES